MITGLNVLLTYTCPMQTNMWMNAIFVHICANPWIYFPNI